MISPRRKRLLHASKPHPIWMFGLLQISFVVTVTLTNAFSMNGIRWMDTTSTILPTSHLMQGTVQQFPSISSRHRSSQTCCRLVSEEDVIEAVEKAERLWAQALEARKTANALSDRAEEEAEAAATSSKEVDDVFQSQKNNSKPITMQQLAQADAAAKSNLDAGGMVNRALAAVEEADRLENLAEEALQQSEAKLEQHLIDFPDSALAH